MADFPIHIFTEPEFGPDTLANLAPLTGMAGIWEGPKGTDAHPVAEGTETDDYLEREVEAFHDQVGYWLWEPAAKMVYQPLAIPRGQVALASGPAAPDARNFTARARRGSTVNGDGTFSYDQETLLQIPGRAEPFHPTDRNMLRRIGAPTPNPTSGRKR